MSIARILLGLLIAQPAIAQVSMQNIQMDTEKNNKSAHTRGIFDEEREKTFLRMISRTLLAMFIGVLSGATCAHFDVHYGNIGKHWASELMVRFCSIILLTADEKESDKAYAASSCCLLQWLSSWTSYSVALAGIVCYENLFLETI